MTMTPAILMVLVRGAFRLGNTFLEARDERLRASDRLVFLAPVPAVTREEGAFNYFASRLHDAQRFPGVFDVSKPGCPPLDDAEIDLFQKAAAIEYAARKLTDAAALPGWCDGSASAVMAVNELLSESARRSQWARFGLALVDTGIEALAADPSLAGLKPRAEILIGAFASKVDMIIGPDGPRAGEVDGVTFKERAASVLLQASLSTIAENPSMIVSAPHWAEFAGAVLSPLAAAQGEEGRRLISLSRLPQLMRGPVAQAALRTLQARQGDFLGERFKTDRALGAITQEILSVAVRAEEGSFDLARVFSQQGLASVYSAALNAAATRPELFVRDGSCRELLSGVAGALRDAPPPFRAHDGLADRLAGALIDIAAARLTARVMEDFADETDPWKLASGRILKSIIAGFGAALPRTLAQGTNPFEAVFNQDQAVEIVRIIAEQAAETPHMLLGEGHRNEIYAIARAVATFMTDPATKLASPADWRSIIAVALSEAAKNPGALFEIDPDTRPENHLAVAMIGVLLDNAARAAGDAPRRRGSFLFGDTLRQAIEMTLRAGANNAIALLDRDTHLAALGAFVDRVQTFVSAADGRMGAAEWLWLYRGFIAEVLASGSAEAITDERLARMVRSAEPAQPVEGGSEPLAPNPEEGAQS